jgi:ABC-2 type transport system ATP-binding protein
LIEIRNLIKDIGQEKTVILSTHIMQEVEAVCDRAIIINKGKIVADNTTENLKAGMIGRQKFIVEFNKKIDIDRILKIQGVENVVKQTDKIFEVYSGNKDIREDIFQFAVDNKLAVLSLQKAGKGIEEVFQQLTR